MLNRRDAAEVGGGLVLLIIGGVVVFIIAIVFSSMAIFGWGTFQRSTADFRGKTSAIEKTRANGSYRIAAYDQFYDECASVLTLEAKIRNSEAELHSSTDPQRKAIVEANLAGQRNQRAEAINAYNADARKTDTRGHFRASDLPFQLDPTAEVTTCHA